MAHVKTGSAGVKIWADDFENLHERGAIAGVAVEARHLIR